MMLSELTAKVKLKRTIIVLRGRALRITITLPQSEFVRTCGACDMLELSVQAECCTTETVCYRRFGGITKKY